MSYLVYFCLHILECGDERELPVVDVLDAVSQFRICAMLSPPGVVIWNRGDRFCVGEFVGERGHTLLITSVQLQLARH